ncbi:beta-barrel assembly-enhancing protease [Thermodesulfovibrio yellowstonii]|uniref:Peptidase M48 n=1 Tax=Thermodesulfovibrio yellowstonii TaxID=28262 RepID=A0A9W6LKK8_9BACT|nr:M48 family metalloprotease [Thermodesulfovibrio islandicus]GLI53777.1 peptidase M48 [Thermodesulfovibrio islandicus]
MKKKFFKVFIVALISLLSLSCVAEIDPISGKKTYTLLSTKQEIEIGQKVVPSGINENEGLYPDREVQNYIRQLGAKIAAVTPRKVDYQFYIVNSPEINAFALPGGPVFITRGIILKMERESELVGVLAHELGHINARHHAKFLEKSFGMSALVSILGIALQGNNYASAVMTVAQISAGLLQLKFSRDQENEADALGVRFAYQSGYDPRGLVTMFEKFKTLERGMSVEWLSTHPLPDTRIKNVQQMIAEQYPDSQRLRQNSNEFNRVHEILKSTKESYDMVEEAKKYIKSRNYTQALNLLDRAIAKYGSNYAYTYRSLVNLSLKRYNEAISDADRAISLDSLYFRPMLIKGVAQNQIGQWNASINTLEKAKSLINDNADLYYYLGVNYQAVGNRTKAIENLSTALQLTDGKRGWEADAQRRLKTLRGY